MAEYEQDGGVTNQE
jgi:hypothetical protein